MSYDSINKQREKCVLIMEGTGQTQIHAGEIACAEKELKHPLNRSRLNDRGMRLLFLFLVNDAYLKGSDLAIARMTGLSVSQVKTGLQQLIHLGILHRSDDVLQFINKRKLIDLWIINYGRLLRSGLILGNYYMEPSTEESLQEKLFTMFPDDSYAIGGVMGSDLLIPYQHETGNQIYIKREDIRFIESLFRLIPSKEFNITLFNLFSPEVIFHKTHSNISVAQPLLIYAELLHNRHISAEETMRIIYGQYL